jgi:hypothetical protein
VANLADDYDLVCERLTPLRDELTGSFSLTPAILRQEGVTRVAVFLHPWSEEVAARVTKTVDSPSVAVDAGPAPRSGSVYGPAESDKFDIPGLVMDRLWHDGYWPHLNGHLNSLFDAFESESISPPDIERMADLTVRFSERYAGRDNDWADTVRHTLVALADFLRTWKDSDIEVVL